MDTEQRNFQKQGNIKPSYFKLDLSGYGKLDTTSELFYTDFIRGDGKSSTDKFIPQNYNDRGNRRSLIIKKFLRKQESLGICIETPKNENTFKKSQEIRESYSKLFPKLYQPLNCLGNYSHILKTNLLDQERLKKLEKYISVPLESNIPEDKEMPKGISKDKLEPTVKSFHQKLWEAIYNTDLRDLFNILLFNIKSLYIPVEKNIEILFNNFKDFLYKKSSIDYNTELEIKDEDLLYN